ncbi:hypothetical protein D5086_025762 [Populus alba]|uniref:Uncharacterized protein n=1 Tax=Populus alba TaxID=43335 RepID=A0ACC4B019_POPAL
MRKIRGFKIGKRLVRISTWIFRRTRIHPPGYNLLGQSESTCRSKPKPISKIINWGRRLTKGAKSLCGAKPGSGYIPMGHELVCDKPVTVPKGHLAVYVVWEAKECKGFFCYAEFSKNFFGMISILQNLEKEGGIGCWVHVTIDCKEQQQVFADEEAFGNIPKKISIMASKHPCGLVLAGVAFSRSVDGSIRSRKATSRFIIVKIMAEGYVMRVNPGIGQLSIPMKFLPKIKQVADARATNVKATWSSS